MGFSLLKVLLHMKRTRRKEEEEHEQEEEEREKNGKTRTRVSMHGDRAREAVEAHHIGFGFVLKPKKASSWRVVGVGGGEGGARNRSEETVRVVVRRRGSESERGERAKTGARNVADEKRIRQRDGRTRKVDARHSIEEE